MVTTRKNKAQTALELAVFGAILIFVLGAIVRAALNRGLQQNSILQAYRMALTQSYRTSNSMTIASRNTATVLVVEDRLTAESAKYGAVDRAPFMMQGTGTHSANVFMPVDFPLGCTAAFEDICKTYEDLPLLDVFVNGKHFSFTTSAFKRVKLPTKCGGSSPCPEWGEDCVGRITTGPCANADPCPAECTGPDLCNSTSTEIYTIKATIGCPKLYTIADNHPLDENWCDGTALRPCIPTCSAPPYPVPCNLSVEDRFDLDRNDLDSIPSDAKVPPAERGRFAWQWILVAGYDRNKPTGTKSAPISNLTASTTGPVTSHGLLMGDGIILGKNQNVDVDVDQDLKLERIQEVHSAADGVIKSVDVLDFQDGDLDFSKGDADPGDPAGFTKDVNIYTFVRDAGPLGGTYLQIDEGKLFSASGDTKQYIRNASKKDSIDIIERIFQLSNDTKRFCKGGKPNRSASIWPGDSNPVEACDNCHTPDNISRTCMDTANLVIFIRSRIQDVHGRKWVTDVSTDPYIDFTTR